MRGRTAIGRQVELEKVNDGLREQALAGVQLRQAHVLDLLDHVLPIDGLVEALATRQATQKLRLPFGPGEGVGLVQAVRHRRSLPVGKAPRNTVCPDLI
jgi:hypothetical protein